MQRRVASLLSIVLILAGVPLLSPAVASAHTVARVLEPDGVVPLDEVDGGGAVWSLSVDLERGYLYKIDPSANSVLKEIVLPLGAPGANSFYPQALAAAFGSLWVADTWSDQVLRLNARTGSVQARIPTGRLDEHLTAGGGSIWTTNLRSQSVTRIDPGTDTAVATIPLRGNVHGTDGPFDASWDPYQDRLIVTLPNTGRVALIDGATQRVRYLKPAPAYVCGRAIPVPGGFWLDDTTSGCSNDMFRWDDAAGTVTAHITTNPPYNSAFGGFAIGNVLYTGEAKCGPALCPRGEVEKRDGTTGDILATRRVDTAAWLPAYAAGDIWVTDFNGDITRVAMF